jgi:hypothetical protein
LYCIVWLSLIGICYDDFLNFARMNINFVPAGVAKGSVAGVCEQAGHQGVHVGSRDFPTATPHVSQGPCLAHTGLLRTHWGGVRRSFCNDLVFQ